MNQVKNSIHAAIILRLCHRGWSRWFRLECGSSRGHKYWPTTSGSKTTTPSTLTNLKKTWIGLINKSRMNLHHKFPLLQSGAIQPISILLQYNSTQRSCSLKSASPLHLSTNRQIYRPITNHRQRNRKVGTILSFLRAAGSVLCVRITISREEKNAIGARSRRRCRILLENHRIRWRRKVRGHRSNCKRIKRHRKLRQLWLRIQNRLLGRRETPKKISLTHQLTYLWVNRWLPMAIINSSVFRRKTMSEPATGFVNDAIITTFHLDRNVICAT